MQKFDEFMTKTAGLYTTCPSKQWIKIEKEFKKYSEEYLKLYEFDLTPEQRVAVQEYVAVFHGFQEFREFNGTKEGYIMAFDKLILEAGRTYDSCTETEWKALEARGSASLLPSHGRGIWPRDVLKKVSRGLSQVEAGNPGFPRLVQVTSGGFSWWL